MVMDEITISKQEYDELLQYKQALIDSEQIRRKSGKAYAEYIEMKKMDKFMTKVFGNMYSTMKERYETEKDYWQL